MAWQHKIIQILLISDLAAIGSAVVAAYYGRFVLSDGNTSGINYPAFAIALTAVWIGLLWALRCYEPRLLGIGTEEFRRIVTTSFALFGAIAIVSYSLKLELARGFIAIALPLGVAGLLMCRFVVRQWIQRQRREGRLQHRVLIVGDRDTAGVLGDTLANDPHSGFRLLGIVIPRRELADELVGSIPVLGALDSTVDVIRAHGIDTVALAASVQVTPAFVRSLSWALEGSGVDVVVAPALADVAGPRIAIRPVAGLPLMYVDEPTFSGWTRLIKRTIDIVSSGLGLLILFPALIGVGVAIRVTSSGPAIYKQPRIGANGSEFTIWKFRTMRSGADSELASTLSDHGLGVKPLFKLEDDPRVTRIGKYLRRFSIDELPQLVNVLRSDMSLVGPRPQRQEEVDHYSDADRRRLMIRPGMTGLWQVSGRSTTSWEAAVRLDLYYVENWSLSLDLTILMRTILAVFRGEGAH